MRPSGAPRASEASQGASRAAPIPGGTSLNLYQERRIRDYFAGVVVPLDTLRVIALQVQFADSLMGGQEGSRRPEVHDSTWFANELRHLEQYYRGASRSRTNIAWTLEGRLYDLPEEMKYYGNDRYEEERVVELAQTLIDSADADVDFSRYDAVFIIHAGAGQETDVAGDSPEQLWSSFYDLGDIQAAADSLVPGLPTGDLLGGEPFYVNNFCVLPEDASQDFQIIGSLGIWAFEAGSRLGLLPMFDADPPGFQDSQGVGNFCVMAYGLFIGPFDARDPNKINVLDGFVPGFPCAFNRLLAGWIDPVTIDADDVPGDGTITLADINSGSDADTLCVKIPITENEYYLVVNRVHDTNFDSLFTFVDNDSDMIPDNTDSFEDAEFDYSLTLLTNPTTFRYDDRYGFEITLQYSGSGVYVWHVDENVVRQNISTGHLPNDFVDRKAVDLEEADGVQDIDARGFIGFMFGSHFDSFRSGDGNANSFGPSTKPNSISNGGAATGISIEDVSAIGTKMTFRLSRTIPYTDKSVRWIAQGESQPATTADIDGDGSVEIVVLADTGLVYVFNGDGTEYDDADLDPTTIAPYITAPDAIWAGPPALGDLDGVAGDEIVAAAADGRLFAWKGTGEELVDGDNDALTDGILYAGRPMATGPALFPFLRLGRPGQFDVLIVEGENDSLDVGLVRPEDGSRYVPVDATFGPLWPLRVQGQYAAPMASARTMIGETEGYLGVVLAWADTLSQTASVSYTPATWGGSVALVGEPAAQGWTFSWNLTPGVAASEQVPSAPASGDLDADDYDEVVATTPDGRLLVFDDGVGTNPPAVTLLRTSNPTGPALGDADLDGTLEIALWDDELMYLKEHNGADVSNWPIRVLPQSAGPQPPNKIVRGIESPVVGDFDGDGSIEAVYALQDGVIYGFESNGSPMEGFPRVGPAGAKATPTVATHTGTAGLKLISVGFVDGLVAFDTVVDTVDTTPSMTLSIQGLPGSHDLDRLFWAAFQATAARSGVVTEAVALQTAQTAVQTETFMIYPNPVPGGEVHARVTLNASANVKVEIYNLEGERAYEQNFSANPSGLIDTPFDELIDISALKSGLYFMRLEIDSGSGTEKLVKPFAIRR